VLWHDGQGHVPVREAAGAWPLHLPSPANGTVVITPAQFCYLLEGIDWRMPHHT
jgi:transposase